MISMTFVLERTYFVVGVCWKKKKRKLRKEIEKIRINEMRQIK